MSKQCWGQCFPMALALLVGMTKTNWMMNMVNLVTSIKEFFRETKMYPLEVTWFLKNWSHFTEQKISGSPTQDPKEFSSKFAAYLGSRDRPSPIWKLWTTTPGKRSRRC